PVDKRSVVRQLPWLVIHRGKRDVRGKGRLEPAFSSSAAGGALAKPPSLLGDLDEFQFTHLPSRI
ncbi:MAG: hypothetical protein JSV00_08125, partial [bacterium]